jgi:hypothetical protein
VISVVLVTAAYHLRRHTAQFQTQHVPAVKVAEPGAATAAPFQSMVELSPGASVVVISSRSSDEAQ